MSIIQRLFNLGKEKTREETINAIVKRANCEFMMILDETRPENRVPLVRVDLPLSTKSMGPELKKLHDDIRNGQAQDLFDAFEQNKHIKVETVLAVKTPDDTLTFRVVYDGKRAAPRKDEQSFGI